jgi:hypothetical protein
LNFFFLYTNLISRVVDLSSYPELTWVFFFDVVFFKVFFCLFSFMLLSLKVYNFFYFSFCEFFRFNISRCILFNLTWIIKLSSLDFIYFFSIEISLVTRSNFLTFLQKWSAMARNVVLIIPSHDESSQYQA